MGVWADAVLSTTASLAKIESEINSLTDTSWTNAIALAKELIGDKLELILMNRGINVDESDSEVLLDVILNPTVFNLSSDYLSLSLGFDDMSLGDGDLYEYKSLKFKKKFEMKFNDDIRRITLDRNLDDTADTYRINWDQGELTR